MVEDRPALVPVELKPFNAETPLPALGDLLTPNPLFYVRNHFEMPRIDAETWRLAVDGAVERRLELSLKDLENLPQHTVTITMECAGNGRRLMVPVPRGTPWTYGAVSTARFTGAPLYLLLNQAKIRPEAVEILFIGADQGEVEPGRVIPFARSLPLDVARHPDTLVAWTMNDETLPQEHGFPLRLVVPEWYGVASVKWLVRISALSRPFDGYFQREHYVYVRERGTPDETPVSLMRVRAIITRPVGGAEVALGPVEVFGVAWSGTGPISRVELSTDGGRSWAEGEIGTPPSSYAAAPWHFMWSPPSPGTYVLMARGTDSAGNTQPLDSVWNTYGYGNNVVHSIRVMVR